jgi:hypothetical protein
MTHVRAWKFRPPAGGEQDFAEAYGANGVWAELFGRAAGFCGTALLAPHERGGWWLTLDRWTNAADFEAFERDFATEYRDLDLQLETVAGEEQFVGAFEETDS